MSIMEPRQVACVDASRGLSVSTRRIGLVCVTITGPMMPYRPACDLRHMQGFRWQPVS